MAGKTGRGRDLPAENSWEVSPCFVVLGGPSLRTFDWSLLRNIPNANVIVVNRAYRDCQTASIFFTEDIRFIEKYSSEKDWATFQGVKVFHALAPEYANRVRQLDPSIVIIERKRNDKFWSKSFADGLSYSSNSGIGALNIADLLGADPIYILGLDCKRTAPTCENYHDDYPHDWRVNGHQLDSFASDFTHWAAPNLRHRNVVNLNAESGVACWPRRNRDSFLKSRSSIGISVGLSKEESINA